MYPITPLQPVDYLVIGHLTIDQTPSGPRLGGTVLYSALTARALGLRVGVVTSWGAELPLTPFGDIPVINFPSEKSTTFENIYTDSGRLQYIHSLAASLEYYHVPEPWRNASIVHLGPVAQEVAPSLARNFPNALIGVTPQGWLRNWDKEGRIYPCEWPEASFVLQRAGATVLSLDDLGGDESRIDEFAANSSVLAVTEAADGSVVYWHGDVRRFRPPQVEEVDPTGAGDIFATAFFTRLFKTLDPWEAGRFATTLSAISVTRPGYEGIPTRAEIETCMVEVY